MVKFVIHVKAEEEKFMTLLNRIKCWVGMHDVVFIYGFSWYGYARWWTQYDFTKACLRCWEEI